MLLLLVSFIMKGTNSPISWFKRIHGTFGHRSKERFPLLDSDFHRQFSAFRLGKLQKLDVGRLDVFNKKHGRFRQMLCNVWTILRMHWTNS